ncbi:MAG: hypothetical protein HY774_22925 [Acidobacteria bacterium]|nr:hypothetical protein [Acidobacteriota bacterium]
MNEKHRVTIYLNGNLWEWLRKHSIDKHKSASAILEDLLSTYKSEVSKERPPAETPTNPSDPV